MSYSEIADSISTKLGLDSAPIAVAFVNDPPHGIDRVSGSAASGCTFWGRAAKGEVFFTTGEDHYNCPIGCFTHGIELPADRASELEETIGTMVNLSYIKADEVPEIPHRGESARVIVYAPLAKSPVQPDVILIQVDAYQAMLLTEAARNAGIGQANKTLGRPACSVIPATIDGSEAALSLGCIGNRTYTGLPRDRMYISLPGRSLDTLVNSLSAIVGANLALEGYHTERRDTLSA